MDDFPVSAPESGRPAAAREAIEERCYDFLDSLGIAYTRVDHGPAHHIETCHVVEAALGAGIAKNLFLCNRQKTQFYLLVLQGDKVFKTKYLSAQLGCSRLSFAGEDDLLRYLGVTPGSASILGLMNDAGRAVTLVLDSPLLKEEYLGLHPCRNTSTLKITMADALEKVIPALGYTAKTVTLPEDAE